MRRAALLLALLPLAAKAQDAPAQPDLAGAVASCASIASRLDRLDCYDGLPADFGLVVGEQGAWRLDSRPGPDGAPVLALRLEAVSGTSGFGVPVELVARCADDTTELFIDWHEYLGADGSDGTDPVKAVTLDLGAGPETADWPVSGDVEATFTPDWAGHLLRRLAPLDGFTARVTPYDGRAITARFDTRGLSEAIAPLTAACNWTL